MAENQHRKSSTWVTCYHCGGELDVGKAKPLSIAAEPTYFSREEWIGARPQLISTPLHSKLGDYGCSPPSSDTDEEEFTMPGVQQPIPPPELPSVSSQQSFFSQISSKNGGSRQRPKLKPEKTGPPSVRVDLLDFSLKSHRIKRTQTAEIGVSQTQPKVACVSLFKQKSQKTCSAKLGDQIKRSHSTANATHKVDNSLAQAPHPVAFELFPEMAELPMFKGMNGN